MLAVLADSKTRFAFYPGVNGIPLITCLFQQEFVQLVTNSGGDLSRHLFQHWIHTKISFSPSQSGFILVLLAMDTSGGGFTGYLPGIISSMLIYWILWTGILPFTFVQALDISKYPSNILIPHSQCL